MKAKYTKKTFIYKEGDEQKEMVFETLVGGFRPEALSEAHVRPLVSPDAEFLETKEEVREVEVEIPSA